LGLDATDAKLKEVQMRILLCGSHESRGSRSGEKNANTMKCLSLLVGIASSCQFARAIVVTVLAAVMAPQLQAQSDLDVLNDVADLLDQGGIDAGSYPPMYPIPNPQDVPGGTFVDSDGSPYIGLNVGLVRQIADQIYAQTGFVLPMDSPFVLGYLCYVAIHEIAHSNCCHSKPDSLLREKCQELQADINGAKATCDFIKALVAGLNGQPPSEFMSALLHLLCQHIQAERVTYNNAHGRFLARDCYAGTPPSQPDGPRGCECTASSWDPPKPDPCSDCPGLPDPGPDHDDPFAGGDIIPDCEECNHI